MITAILLFPNFNCSKWPKKGHTTHYVGDWCFNIANLRPVRRSQDSEEKEDVGKVADERGNVAEEGTEFQTQEGKEEGLQGLKRGEKEEGGSGMESLLHCDSQSSGIFSQVVKHHQMVKILVPFFQESSDRSQCSSRLSWDGETELSRREERRRRGRRGEEKEEGGETQDWRKVRRRSGFHQTTSSFKSPPKPSTPADMWSFGCLLTEAFTGGKLFRQGDKLAAVLRWPNVFKFFWPIGSK